MNTPIKFHTRPLIKAFYFANSPTQLYKELRRITSVSELIKKYSLQSLIEEYKQRTINEAKTIEDIALAYAILVAITFLDYKIALHAFDKFDLSHLPWGEKLMDIYKKTSKITDISSGNFQPLVTKKGITQVSGHTNTKEISPIPLLSSTPMSQQPISSFTESIIQQQEHTDLE